LNSETQDCLGESDNLNMQWEGAKFLLRVTEEHKLTYNGVDNLCDSIQWLVDRVLSSLFNEIEQNASRSPFLY